MTGRSESFGVRLRCYRQATGLTQEAPAERASLIAAAVGPLADALALSEVGRATLAGEMPGRAGHPIPPRARVSPDAHPLGDTRRPSMAMDHVFDREDAGLSLAGRASGCPFCPAQARRSLSG